MPSNRFRLSTPLRRGSRFAVAAASLWLAAFAPRAMAETYYVAPTGNDNNAGTLESSPFEHIQWGNDRLQPGDTLIILEGTYVERVTFDVEDTVITGAEGQTVIIHGQDTLPTGAYPDAKWTPLVRVHANNVELRNVTITWSRGRGLQIYQASGVLVDNVEASHNWNSGIHVSDSDDVTVQNCEVWQNARSNAGDDRGNENWPAALVAEDSRHTTFRKCNVHQNHGENIDDLRSQYSTIEDNISWDSYKIGIYLDNSQFATVQRNIVYSTDDETFWRYDNESPPRPTPGIVVNNEDYPTQWYGTGQLIVNNFVYNTGQAFGVWGGVSGNSYTGSTIAHNTFVSTRTGGAAIVGVDLRNNGTRSGNAFKNNIVYLAAGQVAVGDTTGFSITHNNWFGSVVPDDFSDANDVLLDPLLDLQSGEHPSEEWLMLSSSASPVIDAGQELSGVPEDFFLELRGSNPDMGAHEFSEASPPPPPISNLLANPGFEGTTSWTNYPAANAQQNNSSPHSGTYHLKLTDVGAGFVDVHQTVSVTPSQVYQASVWADAWSSDGLSRGQMRLQWYQGATPLGSPINVTATVDTYTQLLSGNITAPAGATHLRMTLRRSAALPGNYYFDDAEIK